MNQPTQSHVKPLDFIDLIDSTGRTLSLCIHGNRDEGRWLRVLGAIPYQVGIKPKNEAACRKLIEWLGDATHPAPASPVITEAEEARRGDLIVKVLGLKRLRGTSSVQYQTQWGTKTALGLYRTIQRLVLDGE